MDDVAALATNIKQFCWKHRAKIGFGALAMAGGAALYYYYHKKDGDEAETNPESSPKSSTLRGTKIRSEPEVNSERSRMLLAVNELHGFSLVYFLPNIRSRVRALVDVSHAIQKLKELKNDLSEEARDIKVTLWDEINLSAFSALILTIYSTAAASVLLLLQMHILVRDASCMGDQDQPDEDIFYELMEGSYRHLFGAGMQDLAARVKDVVSTKLREGDWNVESRMSVEFDEVDELLWLLRGSMDGDREGLREVVCTLFRFDVSDSSDDAPEENGAEQGEGERKDSTGGEAMGVQNGCRKQATSGVLMSLFGQTRNIMKSDDFLSSFEECVRLLFNVASRDLKQHGFDGQVSNNLPLASLLPKIKGCTERLLPGNLDRNPAALETIRSHCHGPHCESLCMSVFDLAGADTVKGSPGDDTSQTLPVRSPHDPRNGDGQNGESAVAT